MILAMNFEFGWFLTIPGMLITGGVLLLIIALIIFIATSNKEKKTNKEYLITTRLLGKHNVYHILSVLAVAREMGMTEDEVIKAVLKLRLKATPQSTPGLTIWL